MPRRTLGLGAVGRVGALLSPRLDPVGWNPPDPVVRVTDPSFNPANPDGGGKADVRFSVDMNRPLGVLIERYSRLAGIYTTFSVPDGAPLPEDAQGMPVPFVLIPLLASGAVFAVARAVNDRTGPVLAVQILVALFVFIVVTGVVPPL